MIAYLSDDLQCPLFTNGIYYSFKWTEAQFILFQTTGVASFFFQSYFPALSWLHYFKLRSLNTSLFILTFCSIGDRKDEREKRMWMRMRPSGK